MPTSSLRSLTLVLAAALASAVVSRHAAAQWTTPLVTATGVQYRTFWSDTAQATLSYHAYLPPAYTSEPTWSSP